MRIESIHIENFRGIKKLELENLQQLTIVAGINGAGKTSVLASVRILLSWLVARIKNARGRGLAIQENDITNGKDFCKLSMRLADGTEWTLYKQRTSKRGKAEGKTDFGKMGELADTIATNSGNGSDIPLITAYGVNRIVESAPTNLRKGAKNDKLDALNMANTQAVNFNEFFLWFREMEDRENEKLREKGLSYRDANLEAVRNAMLQLDESYTQLTVVRKKRTFEILKNGEKLRFTDLSDGEKTYITLVADIARKMAMTHPGLQNPLKGDGIVLIDEIDQHLHPTWQRSVASKLKTIFPNCQFILTTHSPQVVAEVDTKAGAQLVTLENGEKKHTGNPFGKEPDTILTSVFEMESLRNKEVQQQLDTVWSHLKAGNTSTEAYLSAKEWLKAHLDPSDAAFAKIALQEAICKKRQTV